MKRIGRFIAVAPGLTATEGKSGLPTLSIRKNGKRIAMYRGSSLRFSAPLSDSDKKYILQLVNQSIKN